MLRKEKMNSGGREKDNFFGENSHLTSNNNNINNNYHNYHNHPHQNSSSSNLCDVGSSSMIPPFDPSQFSTRKNNISDHRYYVGPSVSDSSWYNRGSNNGGFGDGVMMDELGLTREFQKMNIGRFGSDCDGFSVDVCNQSKPESFVGLDGFINGTNSSSVENGGGFSSPLYKDFRRVTNFGDSVGPYSSYINGALQRDEFYGNGGVSFSRGNKLYGDRMSMYNCTDYVGNVGNEGRISRVNEGFGNGGFGNEIPVQLQSMYNPSVADDSHLQQYIMEGCKEVLSSWANYGGQVLGDVSGFNSLGSSQLIHSNTGLSRGNGFYSLMRENMRGSDHRYGSPPLALLKNMRRSYTVDGNLSTGHGSHSSGRKKPLLNGITIKKNGERCFDLNGPLHLERSVGMGSPVGSCDSLVFQAMYNSLAEVQGNIHLMAKDQHGCRFLQKKFEEESFEDVQTIFDGIIDHVIELMIDPFGNYLIQKLLDVCNEEQRMKIVHAVTKDRGELVRICLNTHGTRVVQKLIDSLKTRKQISLIIRALEPGFLDLIKDLNGNHVVQRCLQCLNYDDNKFIFDAASKYCVEIATHRHGCCVLQRCIAHSNGDHRKKLIEEICSNGLILAQDPFGNYVVQYIIELKIPTAAAQLVSQFEGNYVHLSMQKFSSHVVEKCLKFIEESQTRIVYELLSVPHFEQLLQDPFANYVVQSALEVTKGGLNESLVAAVRPHSTLRTNPYCKKIFTRGLIRK
ncbi:hypothetical protein RND81_03G184700 [Saponaria officinalis]|uniref:PUM-HD domain-containing protein n=1 Tax=Saponaria officinalis TaxID=3572 RepID=A0AAW1MA61_SAPOF